MTYPGIYLSASIENSFDPAHPCDSVEVHLFGRYIIMGPPGLTLDDSTIVPADRTPFNRLLLAVGNGST